MILYQLRAIRHSVIDQNLTPKRQETLDQIGINNELEDIDLDLFQKALLAVGVSAILVVEGQQSHLSLFVYDRSWRTDE